MKSGNPSGFALIKVIVFSAILGIVLLYLSQLFSPSLRQAHDLRMQAKLRDVSFEIQRVLYDADDCTAYLGGQRADQELSLSFPAIAGGSVQFTTRIAKGEKLDSNLSVKSFVADLKPRFPADGAFAGSLLIRARAQRTDIFSDFKEEVPFFAKLNGNTITKCFAPVMVENIDQNRLPAEDAVCKMIFGSTHIFNPGTSLCDIP